MLRSLPLESALRWGQSPDWIYEEKKDGVRAFLKDSRLLGRNRIYQLPGELGLLTQEILDGELCGGVFWVFDILRDSSGQDLRDLPLWQRRQSLLALQPLFPSWMRIIPQTRGNGGEYLEAVLAAGGEGVVAKRIKSCYGRDWIKAKRLETHDCIVSAIHSGGVGASVSLTQVRDGKTCDCGKCAVGQSKLAQIQTGSVVEIACHSRTASGKFREPRLLRVRTDKPAAECVF